MDKLFAFGCSLTYGHGLPDCIDRDNKGPGLKPSTLGYVNRLANHIFPSPMVVNKAKPGTGNKSILFQLINFIDKIQPNDLVILQWSYTDRHCVIDKKGKNLEINISNSDIRSINYYKYVHNEYDSQIVSSWYINYANFLLKNKGIKSVVNISAEKLFDDYSLILDTSNFLDKSISELFVDRALDNSHPGIKTQQKIANYILEQFSWIRGDRKNV